MYGKDFFIKYKIYFIVAFSISVIFSSIEYYKVLNTPTKRVISSEIFLGTITFYFPTFKADYTHMLQQQELLKEKLYQQFFPNINFSFDLRDKSYSTVKLVYSHNDKANLENTINQIFNIINSYALDDINNFQKYEIKSLKLPYIISKEIKDIKYSFNIYFVLSAVFLSFIAIYIAQTIRKLLGGLNDPKE